MIEVLLPLKTVPGLNAREHWRVRSKRVKRERDTARMLLNRHEPVLPCIVTMIRLSAGALDDDNMQGACKAIRDGVADWLGVDDRDSRVVWRYTQEKCKRGHWGVRVTVEAA